MNRQFIALCVCLLAWNIAFPAFVYIASEAAAINKASDVHGHIGDYDKRIKRMHRTVEAELVKRWPYFHLLAVTAGVNVIVVAVALVTAFGSKRQVSQV